MSKFIILGVAILGFVTIFAVQVSSTRDAIDQAEISSRRADVVGAMLYNDMCARFAKADAANATADAR